MQARIKATGKEILVEPYGDEYAQIFPDGDFKVYTKQELAFPNEIDWQQVHIQAAIAAMQAEISKDEKFMMCEDKKAIIVKRSVGYADALVAELKKGGQDDG